MYHIQKMNRISVLIAKTNSTTMSTAQNIRKGKVLTLDNMNSGIKVMEYAVRGRIVTRAMEIEKEMAQGIKKPFPKVIRANIGNCHAMGGTPLAFIRQVLALTCYPKLIDETNFPDDVKERAKLILAHCKGASVGSYADSLGIELIRQHSAEYITKRDGVPSDTEDIVLCAGASDGIKAVLEMFAGETPGLRTGIMTPVPQYPLYSALTAEYSMSQIDYNLDESKGWSTSTEDMKQAVDKARAVCIPRVLVIINPGNPTGQVLTKQNIKEIIKFAYEEGLVVVADEVYQHNIYDENSKFYSFKKVMKELGAPYSEMELASFMSCSKGYMGECGLRGGYAELINFDPGVKEMFVKSVTAKLCPPVLGQIAMDCVVKPPEPGQESYELFEKEKSTVLTALGEKAKMVSEGFNKIEGISCNTVQGAMYAFPQIQLPPKAVEVAKSQNMEPDAYYAFQLLENTGICVVPGSGFGQKEGTHHIRITILPPRESLKRILKEFKIFHEKFTKEHQ